MRLLYFIIFLSIKTLLIAGPVEPSIEEVFTDKYQSKKWLVNKQLEGSSGEGSLLVTTKEYCAFLQDFINTKDVRSIVDIGCGDWEFSCTLDLDKVKYVGYDTVKSVIQKNQDCYGSDHISFLHSDVLTTDLPQADLLICKDVLQHLTNQDIQTLIGQFKKFKYCLVTNDLNVLGPCDILINQDIERGKWHPIDLTLAPFNLSGSKVLTYVIHRVKTSPFPHSYTKQVLLISN